MLNVGGAVGGGLAIEVNGNWLNSIRPGEERIEPSRTPAFQIRQKLMSYAHDHRPQHRQGALKVVQLPAII